MERTPRTEAIALVAGALFALALSGCAAGGGMSMRMASQSNYCPSSTVLVCTGLYEPERELAPSCGCADLRGTR